MTSFAARLKAELAALPDKTRHCQRAAAMGLAIAEGGAFDPLALKASCCKRAYIRGAFRGIGYIKDPADGYRLEFVTAAGQESSGLEACLSFFGISHKTAVRNGRRVLYLKEAEHIAELLRVMGAHAALLGYENSRVEHDVSNKINRLANCEAANADKLVSASVRQIEDIRRIERLRGLSSLPPQLEELARLRIERPELPISELAAALSAPVSKSGASHRLRRISLIAEHLDDGK